MEMNYTLDMEGTQFANLLSFAEAAAIWRVDQSTIRKAVLDARLIAGRDCRKFGKQWVVTVEAMARVFNRTACSRDYGPWTRHLAELRKAESEQRGY